MRARREALGGAAADAVRDGGYAIVRDTEAEAKRELARITT
jgi:predicted phage gp36 major capsid-like protein